MLSVAAQYPDTRKDTIYDLVEIPEALGPFHVTIDDAAVKEYAFTQDDYDPRHFGPDARIAHSALLANDLLQTYLTKYQTSLHDAEEDSDGSWLDEAHVYERLRFHEPVRLGETVTIEGSYVDKFVRRGRGRVVMEAQARGEDGRLLVEHRGIEVMRLRGEGYEERPPEAEPRKVTGEVRDDLPPADRASADLEPGTPLATESKRPSRAQITIYSSIPYLGTRPSIHTDDEVATRAKLDELVMQGQQGACYIADMLSRFFGDSWFTTGELEVKFIGAVLAGDELTVGGAVVGTREDEGSGATRLDLDVWLRNAEGSLVTIGWASAEVAG